VPPGRSGTVEDGGVLVLVLVLVVVEETGRAGIMNP
jgi:hypothetical protein